MQKKMALFDFDLWSSDRDFVRENPPRHVRTQRRRNGKILKTRLFKSTPTRDWHC